jgi:hypothetical protein
METQFKVGYMEAQFKVGDRVEKTSGYKWPGVVVSVFETLTGERRVVVECTVAQIAGALHIYNEKQLTLMEMD